MIVNAMWWRKPQTMDICIDEFQLYDLTFIKKKECVKRKLLCRSKYSFYEDNQEDDLQKCFLTIEDDMGIVCFQKVFSQIDRWNRQRSRNF